MLLIEADGLIHYSETLSTFMTIIIQARLWLTKLGVDTSIGWA